MRSLLYICSKDFDEYDTLPKTPEEEKLYAQVQKSYAITAKENTDFIGKVREMKVLGISDEEYSRLQVVWLFQVKREEHSIMLQRI